MDEAASAQRGLVAAWQLRDAGFDRGARHRLVRRGTLNVVLPRVYGVGHAAPIPWADELAVLLWLGRDAVISHRSAARLWGLDEVAQTDRVDVTLIGRDCRRRPGIAPYRVPGLEPSDVRVRLGLPVTAPARTLIDLAGCAPAEAFERALAQARVERLVSDSHVAAGYRVIRVTWRQLADEPLGVIARIARALAAEAR